MPGRGVSELILQSSRERSPSQVIFQGRDSWLSRVFVTGFSDRSQ